MTHEIALSPEQGQTLSSLSFPGLHGEDAPRIWLSLKKAGDMWGGEESKENRERFYRSIGLSGEHPRSLSQVHSRRVVAVDEALEGTEADGQVTNDRTVALSVRVADCYPIFLYDAATGAFAALHSGWKGTGIVSDALRLMRSRYGTRNGNVHALLGPGIRSCCYNVDSDRARLFESRFGPVGVVRRDGESFLDLASANLALLASEGVREITAVTDCTSCSPYLGSFRREGPERFTHMLAVIAYLR